MKQILRSGLPPSLKVTLLAFVVHDWGKGLYPSAQTIADHAGISRRQAIRNIQELRDKLHILVPIDESRGGRLRGTKGTGYVGKRFVYEIDLDRLPEPREHRSDTVPANSDTHGSNSDTHGSNSDTRGVNSDIAMSPDLKDRSTEIDLKERGTHADACSAFTHSDLRQRKRKAKKSDIVTHVFGYEKAVH